MLFFAPNIFGRLTFCNLLCHLVLIVVISRPSVFAPVTRLCLTFCNFGSPLRLTLLSALHLRPTFPGISGSRLALSAILAPNSTQNTEHRLKTHNSNTGNIRPPDTVISCRPTNRIWNIKPSRLYVYLLLLKGTALNNCAEIFSDFVSCQINVVTRLFSFIFIMPNVNCRVEYLFPVRCSNILPENKMNFGINLISSCNKYLLFVNDCFTFTSIAKLLTRH